MRLVSRAENVFADPGNGRVYCLLLFLFKRTASGIRFISNLLFLIIKCVLFILRLVAAVCYDTLLQIPNLNK